MILLICTKSAFSKSIRTSGFERRSRILVHSHVWEMVSATEQKPACLTILSSFAFWAVQIIPSKGLASGGPVHEPWLHRPLPCRLRLCFVNLRSSYNETIALKVWVLKSVDNILGNTWVSGRLRPYPAWSCGRKLCWHVTSKADPLVWAVHGPVKVFLPGQVLPGSCFIRKVWFLLFLVVISQ